MKPFFLFSLLVSILLISGCNKMEYYPPQSEGKISEVLDKEENTIGKYTYNKNGLVKESWFEKDFYSPGEKAEYTYTFNSDELLIRKKGYEPGIMFMSSITGAMGKEVEYTYEYDDNGRIEKITTEYDYDIKFDCDYKTINSYEYPNDSTIIESVRIVNQVANSINSHNEYQFNSSGNIAALLTYYNISDDKARITTKTEYTYDNMKAPYNFEPQPTSKNNILKKTITTINYDNAGNQNNTFSSVYTYKYTYNDNDYPISQTETLPNGTEIVKYFKY
jgi:hypothetical protein